MKKAYVIILLSSLAINYYYFSLKEKIDNNKKIQTFLSLFENDNITTNDSISVYKDTSIAIISPVKYINITSTFGNRVHPITKKVEFHNGIDLGGRINDNIYASDIGYVKEIRYDEIGGNQVVIRYGNYLCGYAHLNKIMVKIGDVINTNQVIGKMGNTGRCTGTHLHLTLKNIRNEFLNPELYLKKQTNEAKM